MGREGAANAEFLGNSDGSRSSFGYLSASGGLFSLLASTIGGIVAPHPMLLLFPASVLLLSPGFFILLICLLESSSKFGPFLGDQRG